jgi:RNA polymerase sigma-70 factor, ECF subfamily
MPATVSAPASDHDSELVERIARQDQHAIETLMRKHNSRLFRVARAILKDDADAEDVLQDAYVCSLHPTMTGTVRVR